jgi:glutamate 5-kinase
MNTMKNDQQKIFATAERIVIKVGSNVLTAEHGLNTDAIQTISAQIDHLHQKGIEVVLVSSGAMAAGCKKIGLNARPTEIPARQATAAVGQASLILAYEKAFSRYGKKVAQILLNQNDLNHRTRYLNARNTLNTLLAWGILPIINENDTVVTEEIKFGDNDNLSAMITLLMDADILINLTDIEGLFTEDPRTSPRAELIRTIEKIDHKVRKMAGGIPGALGTGGMLTKIRAAHKVTSAGIPMVIASGKSPDTLIDLFAGRPCGTYFVPGANKLSQRKCWIAFSRKPKGKIQVDDGAAKALLYKGKSLLPVGITAVEGSFTMGDCVEFFSENGTKLGIGLVNYSAPDIQKIMGYQSRQIDSVLGSKPFDEVIHRDNLAITHEN